MRDGDVIALPSIAPPPPRHEHRVVLIDDHGRLREASLFARLGWVAGTSLIFTERGSSLLVTAAVSGPHRLDPKGRLRVPEGLRKFRSWTESSAVLLSLPDDRTGLLLSPTSLLDALVVPHVCA